MGPVAWCRFIHGGSLSSESGTREMSRLELILIAALCFSCGREACYANNDADFDESLARCEREGITYDDCPEVPAAEAEQERKDALCP